MPQWPQMTVWQKITAVEFRTVIIYFGCRSGYSIARESVDSLFPKYTTNFKLVCCD